MTEGHELSADEADARRARRNAAFRRQRLRILLSTIVLVSLGLAGIFFGAIVGGDIGFDCFAGTCATNDPRIWIGTVGAVALAVGALTGSLLGKASSTWRLALGGAALAGALATVAGALIGGPSSWTQLLVAFLVGQLVAAAAFLFLSWRDWMRRRRYLRTH